MSGKVMDTFVSEAGNDDELKDFYNNLNRDILISDKEGNFAPLDLKKQDL